MSHCLGRERSAMVKPQMRFKWNINSRTPRTFAVVAIIPNALNVSYSNLSSTFSSKFPMNKFAPTSSCFLSDDAWGDHVSHRGLIHSGVNRTYDTMPVTTDEKGSNLSPLSFKMGCILNVCKIDAIIMNSEPLAKWRPGHTLCKYWYITWRIVAKERKLTFFQNQMRS